MSIAEIIQAGNMSARLAALFWVGLERGASVIIAAGPPSSGKTTTLSALLAFTPPDTLVYFTRGLGETFALPPPRPEYPTYLLINELSDHIPVYTWDDNARTAFRLLTQGYRLASTMHADTVEGVVEQLSGELSIPEEQIAHVNFIVAMYVGRLGGVVRRVAEVAFSDPEAKGGRLSVARWDRERDAFAVLEDAEARRAFAGWARLSEAELERELDRREGFLRSLISGGKTSIPEVSAAVEDFYTRVLKAG